MVGHALKTFEAVVFVVGEANVRSRSAMEKVGGILTDRTIVADMASRPVRHVVCRIDRDGFAAGPLAVPRRSA